MSTIVIEGASTAYGIGGGEDRSRSWANHVRLDVERYNHRALYAGITVVNRAREGWSITAINRQWHSNPPHGLLANIFGSVRILSTGQNEPRINPDTMKPLVSVERFVDALATYSQDSRTVGVPYVYVGPQLVDESKTMPTADTGWYIENDLIEEYADAMRQQAASDNMPYVDVAALQEYTGVTDTLAADGRHPNVAGHSLIYRGVRVALSELGVFPALATSQQ